MVLVPKPPKNCARCTRCGHPVDGLYCQGCTFLKKKLKEDLVTNFQGFQNTSESSDDSTNVVNIPLEQFVVKQDHRSFKEKIICGLNKAPDLPHLHTFLPNQFHCFHCKDVLRDVFLQILHTILHTLMNVALCGDTLDGIFCQQCTCKSCGKVPCVSKPNFVDESSNIFNTPPQPPIYSGEFCWSNAKYGHYCIPQVPFINPKPGYSQDFNFPQDIYDFQQQYLCCDLRGGPHETSQCFDQTQPPQSPVIHPPLKKQASKFFMIKKNVFKIKDTFGNEQYKLEDVQELFHKLLNDVQNIHEELTEYINTPSWNRPTFYNNGDDDDVDYTIAI
nr:hypothetical protein [Tanacetum cinerariifolium]